jgi:RNA polymerase sigma-70 factor, ECF subfamily
MQAMAAVMRLEPIGGGDPAPATDVTRAADPADARTAPDLAEAELVHASVAGDEDAFAELVRRHQARVFRLAGRFFRQRQDVEEVAQETFLRAWLKLGTYGGRAPFEHWLTRLCLRCAYDRLRRPGRSPAELAAYPGVEEAAEGPPPDPTARLEVERLLARLQPADRFLLVLLEAEGWSVAEIAERLGWSRVNVKVRAHRARQRLRRVLEEG